MDKLKPCPFCGSSNINVDFHNDCGCKYYQVSCNNCYSYTSGESREDAIKGWNNRYPDLEHLNPTAAIFNATQREGLKHENSELKSKVDQLAKENYQLKSQLDSLSNKISTDLEQKSDEVSKLVTDLINLDGKRLTVANEISRLTEYLDIIKTN